MKLDKWQEDVLATKDQNLLLCSGRQTGKSFICSRKAVNEALDNKNFSILIISNTERQSEELLQKCLIYLSEKAPKMIKGGKDRPTKHIINLRNGSIIRCLPTGLSASGIRGFTINLLIVDEAAYCSDDIFPAVTPMLLTTAGKIWLISTPRGRQGYFYQRFLDPTYKIFHINSEQVVTEREISESWTQAQRDGALAFLESEKRTMTQKQYAQEYLGQFVEDLTRFFPDELIDRVCVAHRRPFYPATWFMGCDIARLGGDQNTFEIIDATDRNHMRHTESITTTKKRIPETIVKILELEKIYNFRKIYIDTGGIGGSVFDFLLQQDATKRKIESIDNAKRSLDRESKHKTGLMKEDLYNNLLLLMEQGKISILNDDEVKLSLKSVQYEYVMESGQPTRLRIWSSYGHIAEGLIRAAWCNKEKDLNIWIASKSIGV